MRFPPNARIRSSADFDACFAARQRLSGRYFLVHWRHNGLDSSRLGLAVSRRVDRRATRRNRIKRLLREFFRQHREALTGFDFVLIPRPEAAKAPIEALRDELERLWKRMSELPPPPAQGTMPRALAAPPDAEAVTSAVQNPTC